MPCESWSNRQGTGRTITCLLLLAGWLGWVAGARAELDKMDAGLLRGGFLPRQGPAPRAELDKMDAGLLREAPRINRFLKDNGYEKVGVLKFRVMQGKGKPTFGAGMMNLDMADRLSWALVHTLGKGDRVQLIKRASEVAFSRDKMASYREAADRRKLFTYDYPLLWGKGTVKADIFLTGVVKVGVREMGKTRELNPAWTSVVIESFSRKDPARPVVVSRFTVRTDRSIVASSGKGFRVSSKKLRTSRSLDDETGEINPPDGMGPGGGSGNGSGGGSSGGNGSGGGASGGSGSGGSGSGGSGSGGSSPGGSGSGGSGSSTSESAAVKVTLKYGKDEQTLTPADGASNEKAKRFTVAAPPKIGDTITLVVENKLSEKIGVVVTVNGISTLYEEKEDNVAGMARWILDANKSVTIEGFYQSNNTSYKPFEVVTPEEFKKRGDLAPESSLGVIAVHVIRSGPRNSGGDRVEGGGKGFRGMGGKGLRRPASLAAAKSRLQKHLKMKGGRNFIGASGTVKETKLEKDQLPDPTHAETLLIRYYQPSQSTQPGGGGN